MSKPFTYWVRLALVATLCTLVTFSPVSAGRLMDRLLHRDQCKVNVADRCEVAPTCEPSCLVVPAAPCQPTVAPITTECQPVVVASPKTCDAAPPCGCDAMPSTQAGSAPAAEHPAPVVEKPAPVVEKPAPVAEKPAPVVEKPAPVVEKPAPLVEKPAPVVETPAPVVEKPAPAIEKSVPAVAIPEPKAPVVENTPLQIEPAPVVKTPDPVVEPVAEPAIKAPELEPPAAIEPPALAPEKAAEPVVPNPFDEAVKAPDEAAKAPDEVAKAPEADLFGNADEVKAPVAEDNLLDPPAAEQPAAEPERAAEEPGKNELDDLFGKPDAAAPADAAPAVAEPQENDLFNLDGDAKPALPPENAPPKVEPAKTDDNELDDLFNLDKPEKPVAKNSAVEILGKPVTTEVGTPQGKSANLAADDDSFLDNLFSNQSAKPIALPEQPAPEVAKPEAEAPKTDKSQPAAEKQVDELDSLFGVGAFTPPTSFQGAEYRTWVDNSGAYQVKARLAVIYVDKVKLLKENGKFTTVPLSRLSEADFGYVSWVASNLTGDQAARMVKTNSDQDETGLDR